MRQVEVVDDGGWFEAKGKKQYVERLFISAVSLPEKSHPFEVVETDSGPYQQLEIILQCQVQGESVDDPAKQNFWRQANTSFILNKEDYAEY
eukprot:g18767.t1